MKEEVVGEEEEEDIESPEEESEVIAEADKGEMLVFRRALNSYRSEKGEQREHISFPMYCSGKSMFNDY